MYSWSKVIADLCDHTFHSLSILCMCGCGELLSHTRKRRSPLIHRTALRGNIFIHFAQQTCKLPVANHHSLSNWFLWDLRLTPPTAPPSPSAYAYYNIISVILWLFSLSFSFSLDLSLSGNLDRWALWWLPHPIHNQFTSAAYLLIIVFLCSGLLCPGVGWMRPWSWVLIWLSTDNGRGWMTRTRGGGWWWWRYEEIVSRKREEGVSQHVKQARGRREWV